MDSVKIYYHAPSPMGSGYFVTRMLTGTFAVAKLFVHDTHTLLIFVCVAFTDSSYTHQFNSFISLNDTVPYNSYGGPGTCYTYKQYVDSSGVSTLNCSPRRGYNRPYLLTVGRYVTIMPYAQSSVMYGLTICEVTVTGVRQSISADGK